MKYYTLVFLSLFLLIGAGCNSQSSNDPLGALTDLGDVDTAGLEIVELDDVSDDESDLDESTEDEDGQSDNSPSEDLADADDEDVVDDEPEPELVTCEYEGMTLQVGGSYDDGCNTHTCQEDGSVLSTEVACKPEAVFVSMESGNFFFSPSSITAEPGQEVVISITENSGTHTFVIDEIGYKSGVSTGDTLSFTAPTEPGSYSYYCDVGSHRALGMEGTLIVE